MASWVIPLYIFSGLLMFIGIYLAIRYRPYCILKSPERELAMELYRKKLLNENMSSKQIEKYNIYKRDTKLYTTGMRILLLPTLIHVIALIMINHQLLVLIEMYIISVVLIVPIYYYAPIPICFSIASGDDKNILLKKVTIYLKKLKGEFLSNEDVKFYKDELQTDKAIIILNSLFRIGVILILILDLISLIVKF